MKDSRITFRTSSDEKRFFKAESLRRNYTSLSAYLLKIVREFYDQIPKKRFK